MILKHLTGFSPSKEELETYFEKLDLNKNGTIAKGRNDCDDDELDLPENKIGHIQIKENKFVQNIADFIEIDKDPNYSDKFISDNVKIIGNEISQRCNCTSPDVPNDPNDRTDNEKVKKMFIDSSRYF